MKTRDVSKIRDEVATHVVVADEPFPRETADTVEQFVPVTDAQGRVQLVGKRIVPEEKPVSWRTYNDAFVQAMGLSMPNIPGSMFTTIENFKEAMANHEPSIVEPVNPTE